MGRAAAGFIGEDREGHQWKLSAKVSGISGETENVTISRISLFPLEILLNNV